MRYGLLCTLLCGATLVALATVVGYGQRPATARQAITQPLTSPIKVDGLLGESLYEVGGLTDFTQFSPSPLDPARQRTEVWIAYDDNALYVSARLYDTAPDSILQQLSERDRLRNTDWFGVTINPYRDGINATNFIVTPANVQYDSKFSADGGGGSNQVMQSGDRSWDGVWASATRIDDEGWTVELRIPYSALRFPDEPVQLWDINFARQTRRYREESFWNTVDPKGPPAVTQMGVLSGITDIKPPIRLQATPFVTAAALHNSDPSRATRDEWSSNVGGGLDLKYGISDAFTLDMTAIPDFSNARSDDQVLNLTANEIFFDENRAFFTEGVELFNKGGFFYSRRVGGVPFRRGEVSADEDEEIIENPIKARLLNATKVSGRLQNGLGIGVFNAIEGRTFAEVRNTVTGEIREVETGPRTNYSVVSFDQNLPNNSFVTLLNTNVLREGSAYDANLTGVVFDLRTKANTWSLNGSAAVSQQYGIERPADVIDDPGPEQRTVRDNVFGYLTEAELERITGRLRYGVSGRIESDTYDPNDLGFLFFNNELGGSGFAEYNWFEPFGKFNSARVEAFIGASRLYKPGEFTGGFFGTEGRFTTQKFFTFGYGLFSDLSDNREFQDSRTPGLAYRIPQYASASAFISSDYRRRFALDVRAGGGRFYDDATTNSAFIRVSPRFRVNDRFDFRISGEARKNNRFLGYVGHTPGSVALYGLEAAGTRFSTLELAAPGVGDDEIIGSYRDIRITDVEANANYSFTANMTASLRVRHYWSQVNHDEFFEFGPDQLPRPTLYTGLDDEGAPTHDQNFNAFNIDLFYRWRFAPGSDLFISYKTQSFFEGLIDEGYVRNLGALGQDRIDNSLTLKLIYFIDAAVLRAR